jgi:hypothetical protein
MPKTVPAELEDIDADELRQTQTLRAISVAKSIDDISNSMAETLFNDADIEMLSAALASAGWSGDHRAEPPVAELSAAEPSDSKRMARMTPSVDDSFDLFDLGDDAPLELIDDSSQRSRKIGSQR